MTPGGTPVTCTTDHPFLLLDLQIHTVGGAVLGQPNPQANASFASEHFGNVFLSMDVRNRLTKPEVNYLSIS